MKSAIFWPKLIQSIVGFSFKPLLCNHGTVWWLNKYCVHLKWFLGAFYRQLKIKVMGAHFESDSLYETPPSTSRQAFSVIVKWSTSYWSAVKVFNRRTSMTWQIAKIKFTIIIHEGSGPTFSCWWAVRRSSQNVSRGLMMAKAIFFQVRLSSRLKHSFNISHGDPSVDPRQGLWKTTIESFQSTSLLSSIIASCSSGHSSSPPSAASRAAAAGSGASAANPTSEEAARTAASTNVTSEGVWKHLISIPIASKQNC